ncbi:hypothetical protein ACQFX9_28085 [Aliinostoc sp. HNIBRCY26]|uniref:hypothetical protein n=1 Tax=Aliinostoc sp. HNIBRCY26 TaxID=3418997 RepID=UPI003D033298
MKQIVKQVKERSKVELEWRGIKYQLWRLDDAEFRKLRYKSLPIKDDYMLYVHLYLSERDNKDKLNLAQIFVTLTYLFGESSNWIDDWKGTFSFPILLVLDKPQGKFFYLLDIYDNRGTLYFSFYRILEADVEGYDTQILREPFELEFSRQEINYFISYFNGYTEGYFKTIEPLIPSEQFFRKIGSNHIIYGYKDEQYFEEHYESQEEYQAAIENLELMGISSKSLQDVNNILQTITSGIVEK